MSIVFFYDKLKGISKVVQGSEHYFSLISKF